MFQQDVGNIPAGAQIVCELVLDQPLSYLSDGQLGWRFPTVVAPRYQGAVGRAADAAKQVVDVAQGLGRARAGLHLSIGDALTGPVSSPSHHVVASEGQVIGQGALDRDIVVRWPRAGPAGGVSEHR